MIPLRLTQICLLSLLYACSPKKQSDTAAKEDTASSEDSASSDDTADTGLVVEEQEAYRITRSISYNDLEVDVIIDKPVGNSFDVLVVYHGTVWSDNQIHSAATMTLEKFSNSLQREDVMIVSVVYPEENLKMGDNIIYAEAGLLWVQQLASEELGIEVKRVFLGGHSQGGYLVTRLNTMHTTDGVIANCPGPLDMRYRCQLEEDGLMQTSNQCQVLLEEYGTTTENPAPYDAISLLNFTEGYKAPYLVFQGMDDADIQLHSWPIFTEAIGNCTDCSSIQTVEVPNVGHPGLFESPTAAEVFNAFVE